VQLTEAGRTYSRRVTARLDDLERDTLAVMGQHGPGQTLELAVVPTFATRWLLPRLRGFHDAHPGITVNLTNRTRRSCSRTPNSTPPSTSATASGPAPAPPR
jgi:DNA-binding transcriptional LysR family regulator